MDSASNITNRVKQIQENFTTKPDTSKKLVMMERQLDDVKLNQRVHLINDYNDLIEWLMMIYNNPRCKVNDDQVKSITQAYTQTQKIAQIIEFAETNLKNQRVEIENKLIRDKKDFAEMLDEVKKECEKFRENENKNKEAEFNRQIVNIN
jgi:hypothetical protein